MLRFPSFLAHALILLPATLIASVVCAASLPVTTPHVEAQLVAEKSALEPGRTLTVALRLKMEKEWHTYWQNPGETGLPTTLKWTLPAGYTAGPIQWPAPERIDVGPLANYGYEGEILLLTDISVPTDAATGRETALAARADWLVCREVCIPDGADLALTLPVQPNAQPDARWSGSIAKARADLPVPLKGWDVGATRQGNAIELALASKGGAKLSDVQFFPFDEGKIEPSAKQMLTQVDNGYRLRVETAKQPVGEFRQVRGVLVSRDPWGAGLPRAVTIDTSLVAAALATSASAAAPESLPGHAANGADLSWPLAVLFALVGGVLLNLMPCVFPVISIKVLGFAQKSGHDSSAVRVHGLVFALGVVLSFVALAAVLFGARAAGEELGWGFQL